MSNNKTMTVQQFYSSFGLMKTHSRPVCLALCKLVQI